MRIAVRWVEECMYEAEVNVIAAAIGTDDESDFIHDEITRVAEPGLLGVVERRIIWWHPVAGQ